MSAARAGGATLLLLLLTAVVAVGVWAPASAFAQEPTWRLEQPDPPAGSRFQVPLGRPGDIQCFAVDRCLMAVEGNATVRRGSTSTTA